MKLGVTTWSLQQPTMLKALKAAHDLGFSFVQLGLGSIGLNDPAELGPVRKFLRQSKMSVVSTCCGFPGENYTTLETIHQTGGFGWPEKLEERYGLIVRSAELTRSLGVRLITAHAGFIPEDPQSHEFNVFVMRMGKVGNALRRLRLVLGLESGQETAKTLHHFLRVLKRPNVKVNFDPANMILYGMQPPMDALGVLYKSVAQVHLKDARWTKKPGTWGREVPLGEGEAQISKLLASLKRRGFRGPLIIEREAGNTRIGDIQKAKELVDRLL